MGARVESLPIPRSTQFGQKIRWAIVAVALVVAAAVGSAWAIWASSSNPTSPARIQTPVPQPEPLDPYGCGLNVQTGPC
jgi:flagellar basal body-associated protein FliL